MYRYEFAVDKELKICFWDINIEKISGKAPAEVLGIPYFQIQPRIINENMDALEQVLRYGKPVQIREYQVPCLCGKSKADIHIRPLKKLETEIIGAHVTVEINPDCLLSTKLNESKTLIDIGKASAGLAHGVRSPLNAIKGAIVYLRGKYDEDPTFSEFSRIIEDEISKLDKFVTKFLSNTVSKPEITEIELNPLLDKIIALLKMQALSVNIKFARYEDDILKIKADYFQIEQAILNIINNAIESMHNGGLIDVKTYMTVFDNKDHVTIEITDSGQGFEDSGPVKALKGELIGKGRGFGLFITHEIVKNLGGYLEIASEKMVGTVVKINLPVDKC